MESTSSAGPKGDCHGFCGSLCQSCAPESSGTGRPAIRYRSQIDGLRAVAIVPVLLFHGGLPGISGGFTGVDVFFVISGFLITAIIRDELSGGSFSIARFYERRARRILPALFPVLVFSLGAAWLVHTPLDFRRFAQALGGTALFASNFVFAQKADYFFSQEGFQPLIHGWSLAVEEQFYLLFPAAMLVLHRWRNGSVLMAVLAVLAGSFALSLLIGPRYPQAAFYMLPFRAWELMAGAACALLPAAPRPRELPAFTGLAMIFAGFWLIGPETPAPGAWFVLPVAGSALVLLFAGEGTVVARVLSWRPMVWTGLISYGTYLWHQPLLAFLHYGWFGPVPVFATVAALALSLMLGAASYRFIEQPVRSGRLLAGRRRLALACAGFLLPALVIGALGQFLLVTSRSGAGGIGQQVVAHSRAEPELVIPATRPPPFVLYGDSHAAQYYEALVGRLGPGALISDTGCLAAPGVSNWPGSDSQGTACRAMPDRLAQVLRDQPPPVVIWAQRWDREVFADGTGMPLGPTSGKASGALRRGLERMLERMPPQTRLVLLGNSPTAWAAGPALAGGLVRCRAYVNVDCPVAYPREMAEGRVVSAMLRDFAATHPRVDYVDVAAILCDRQVCPILEDGQLHYWDGSHMTGTAARRVVEGLPGLGSP